MENIKKRINNSKDYLRCVSKPNFISPKIFDKNFIALHQIKSVLTLNKPICVGFSILELSKSLMYKFHYDYVYNKYDTKLLLTGNKYRGINKKLRHKEYVDVLFNKKVVTHNMKRIKSKLHEISTYDVFKISLSCFDDKRYVLDDGINTLAYFHKDIKNL